MSSNRLFCVFVVVALAVMAALTVRQAAVTTEVVSAAASHAASAPEHFSSESSANAAQCPFTQEERRSQHAVYLEEAGLWMPRTDGGYTGFEGGLLALRDCR
ncbi:MAG: hypothetical protein ACRDH2_00215 [Anaerolineales bacterium]